ncbi:hypothetical protein [Kurthia sp. Dielmo]|uniref:hypothetical protein n=1 Tax=Kurthia sp. Dielmo TaxID=1033738 RepID=UPI0011207486|nr:hypothetical protein [Kurthia sp. Dielmo]
MKFVAERKIENRVLSVNIKFDSYGEGDLTDEQEKALVSAFGNPVISVGGEFKAKFDEKGQFVEDPEAIGEEVSFIIVNKTAELGENFVASYSIGLDKAAAYINEKSLLKEDYLQAVARCELFEKTIQDRAVAAADKLQAKSTAFTTGYPRDFFA